jgi:hypothetical protein
MRWGGYSHLQYSLDITETSFWTDQTLLIHVQALVTADSVAYSFAWVRSYCCTLLCMHGTLSLSCGFVQHMVASQLLRVSAHYGMGHLRDINVHHLPKRTAPRQAGCME